ncbi:valine--tRNA ligase [Treponema ruminis]|uniref:Valine--tRNA ligase n=1 Tax=Treponema ruminis TaxID=744515 RepID=A0A7W8LM04_9SPIR|nr:valine--tRNA ligase [Treponema ruminis]MBB5225888.1 valyl-tRNA synthetase [Treponema ruminis]QSI03199.1 valine--tRNA ligase [Treponema ruminis]
MHAIELEKAYNPKEFEDRIYSQWVEKGYFKPSSDSDSPVHSQKKSNIKYTVVIPPPNVTGVLHMGHGLNNTLQDIVVRYHRMKGDDTLWIPGTDHAGIATQNVVERALKKEGKSRNDLGREKFIERTWEVTHEHHDTIVKQQKKLGNSVDWSRERFTYDEGLSKAVRDVFVTLYERGLMYKGQRLVNWCPRCGTALADDEVDHVDTQGAMYHLFYEYADGSGKIEVATTRPETFFGDTAVAVNPDDERYKALVGKMLKLPLTGKEIPIIADSYVDKEFGTGMVKITPAHDPNDWEVGLRHNLEVVNLLNPDGTLNDNVPEKYRGLKCEQARKLVIEDLTEAGLFKGEEKMVHSVGHCYRCKTVVEPYLSYQWFVKMKPLAEKALKAWRDGEIVFYPRKWENTYTHWMENIRDWCVSRQIWWGHRIPAWYCECGETIVSREDVTKCPKCGSTNVKQDPDVLDTWFSSWLWPFSTLGWPENTKDLAEFYPTTALVTAYDIIFFWVSRMIMAGLEFTGKAPFHDIYIHGLVRDKQGRKMSKSLGNGIDPLDIIDQYGSDALKFTLSYLAAQGQDVLVDNDSFKMGSRFCNKVWNASRYILGNLEGRNLIPVKDSDLNELDKWIFTALNAAAKNAREALDGYRYNDAASTVYEFFWNNFCDWYVEATKLSFWHGDDHEKDRAVSVLLNVLEESLRLLHPFIPFVTEEIYSKLPLAEIIENRKKAGEQKVMSNETYSDLLVTAPYPEFTAGRENAEITARFAALQDLIRSVRGLRNECGVNPADKINLAVLIEKGSAAEVCREKVEMIQLLAGLSKVEFVDAKPTKSIGTVGVGFEAFIILDENINKEQLLLHFQKDLEKDQKDAERTEAKLNGKFAEHAPAEVVQAERDKLAETKRRIEKLGTYIEALK